MAKCHPAAHARVRWRYYPRPMCEAMSLTVLCVQLHIPPLASDPSMRLVVSAEVGHSTGTESEYEGDLFLSGHMFAFYAFVLGASILSA